MRVQWVWVAVGAVAGSLCASEWAVETWSQAMLSLAIVVSLLVAIWSSVDDASPIALRRAVSTLRGAGLAVAWAGVCHLYVPMFPEAGTELGELARGGEETAVVVGRVVRVAEPRPEGWVVVLEPWRFDGRPVDGDGWRLRVFWGEPPGRKQSETSRLPPLPGDRIEAFIRLDGYPESSFPKRGSPRRIMARRGVVGRGIIDGEMTRESPDGWEALTWSYRRVPASWRTSGIDRLVEHLGRNRAAFPAAMVLGARGLLEGSQTTGFEATGTAHLLAISGLHLGVVGAWLWWGLGMIVSYVPSWLRRWGRRRVCGFGVVAILGCYVLAIGAPTSAVRAWWMVTCGVVALIGLRAVDPLRMLAAAVYAMLIADPLAAGGLGFQLSVGATAAILTWLDRLPSGLSSDGRLEVSAAGERGDNAGRGGMHLWRRVGAGIGVSVVATLVTWPIIVSMTGEVPLAGIVANVVVTPLASATVIPWMFIGVMLAMGVGSPGWWMLRVGAWVIEWLAAALTSLGAWPVATWVTGVPPGALSLLGVMGGFVVAAGRCRRRPVVVGMSLLAASLATTPVTRAMSHWLEIAPLQMHVIPVGQGDATLVITPGGQTMLVDAGGRHFGGDPGRSIVVPYLKRIGIGRLDWVVVSHADTDHIGGMTAVVQELAPKRAVFDGSDRSKNLVGWLDVVEAHRVTTHPVVGVRRFDVGDVDVRVVRPDPPGGSANDRSLYIDITHHDRRLVLPGDIEAGAERWLRRRGDLRAADVMKVPHHGSKTSTSRALLAELRPLVGIVSAGADNPFGHPHARVLRRLEASGVAVWSTAGDGLVVVSVSRSGRLVVRVTKRSTRHPRR